MLVGDRADMPVRPSPLDGQDSVYLLNCMCIMNVMDIERE